MSELKPCPHKEIVFGSYCKSINCRKCGQVWLKERTYVGSQAVVKFIKQKARKR